MIFNDKVYDRLKFVALIVIPAVAALYLGLGQIWHWGHVKEVGTSLALVATFLGSLLQISNSKYKDDDSNYDGYIEKTGEDELSGNPDIRQTLTKDPNDMLLKKEVRLKVKSPSEIEEH